MASSRQSTLLGAEKTHKDISARGGFFCQIAVPTKLPTVPYRFCAKFFVPIGNGMELYRTEISWYGIGNGYHYHGITIPYRKYNIIYNL